MKGGGCVKKKKEAAEGKTLWVKRAAPAESVTADAAPEAEAPLAAEPVLETQTAPKAEAAPEAEAASETEAAPEAEAAPETEAAPEAEAAPKAEAAPETEALPALAATAVKAPRRPGPFSPFLRAFGNFFYSLGFSAEYVSVLFWRGARDVLTFAGQMLAWMGSRIWEGLQNLARGAWKDITGPIAEFRRRQQLLHRVRERARRRGADENRGFRGAQVRSSMWLVARLAGYLLPLLAAGVLVFTVQQLLGMNYALEVTHNGQFLGYVADQGVVEGAKDLLRDRIRIAGNQQIADWQLAPSYSIANARELTTTQQMVNAILLNSGQEEGAIIPATGLYIRDELFTVTTEGDELKTYLDGLLSEQESLVDAMAEVSFVQEVVCEPNTDDLYFASSVEDLDSIISRLSANTVEEKRIAADGASSLEIIARDNGLTLDTLLVRNPALAETAAAIAAEGDGNAGEYVPEAGAELLINRAEPFLQVQTCVRERAEEPIPFETIEQENPELLQNIRRTVQEGVNGVLEVWDDVYYVDGEVDSRERVEELTRELTPAQPRIVEVGTMEAAFAPGVPEGGYGAGYIFPVPASPYSSRGFGGGHNGYDINAPAGTPVYVIQGGTVSEAGWHWSYGNYVVVDHGGGVQSLYAHCTTLLVGVGQGVGQGQNIATVGNTGYSFGNHLHLEMRINGARIDPRPYVGYPY